MMRAKKKQNDFCHHTLIASMAELNTTQFSGVVCCFNYFITVLHTMHQYLPSGDKILYLLSCHSSAQATLIIPWQLLTHFKASVALNSIPKPRSCCILKILSPNIISGREGICNSSASLRRKKAVQ